MEPLRGIEGLVDNDRLPDLKTVLRLLLGLVVGGAAAWFLLSLWRSGSPGERGSSRSEEGESTAERPPADEDQASIAEEAGIDESSRKTLSMGGATPWLEAAACTHRGKVRDENQDRFVLQEIPGRKAVVALVNDGMGGHMGGSVAAEVAANTIAEIMKRSEKLDPEGLYERLAESFERADLAIRHRASKETGLGGMGTTGVAAVVLPDVLIHLHTGDSRLYHYRDGQEIYRTKDHSVVRYLQEEGLVSEAEARNHPMRSRLTSSLGGSPPERKVTVEPRWKQGAQEQPAVRDLRPGDVVLLCSDGLSSEIEPETLDEVVRKHGKKPAQFVREAVKTALDAGGRDNVTVIALYVCRSERRPRDPSSAG
ncbi:MAG: serine/threonine-protein phosphatase [Armatimonadetes bacterium]|nr:serine/threonine-protein phosphatase [Armatimonadota bacterium]